MRVENKLNTNSSFKAFTLYRIHFASDVLVTKNKVSALVLLLRRTHTQTKKKRHNKLSKNKKTFGNLAVTQNPLQSFRYDTTKRRWFTFVKKRLPILIDTHNKYNSKILKTCFHNETSLNKYNLPRRLSYPRHIHQTHEIAKVFLSVED